MNQSMWSLAGYCFGSLIVISSWYRYYLQYPDMDRLLFYGLSGLMVVGIAWLYNENCKRSADLEVLNNYLKKELENE